MKTDSRYIIRGAAAGAVLGALAGWAAGQVRAKKVDGSATNRNVQRLESGQLMRLGGTIVALIRQIIDLG